MVMFDNIFESTKKVGEAMDKMGALQEKRHQALIYNIVIQLLRISFEFKMAPVEVVKRFKELYDLISKGRIMNVETTKD